MNASKWIRTQTRDSLEQPRYIRKKDVVSFHGDLEDVGGKTTARTIVYLRGGAAVSANMSVGAFAREMGDAV